MHFKTARTIFHLVANAPDTRKVEQYAFENREKEMEKFIGLSLSNLNEIRSPTPNNRKIQLAIASQMLGSGKTWFGRFLLDSARKNRQNLLAKFAENDLDYFLSAHYVGIDLRQLMEQRFSTFSLKELLLRCMILQCPVDEFHEARNFWNDKDIYNYRLEDLAMWFFNFLNRPLFFHFDEVDAINASLVSYSIVLSC